MTRTALTLVLLATLAPAARAQTLTITNISVIDVSNGRISPHMNVAVDGKRITAISTKPIAKSAGATLDGTGMYLIPGLWDMHIHAFFTNDSARFHSTSELMFPLFVANGVTGVRDMGSNLDAILAARDSIAAHQLIGPRMVVAGPMLDGPTSRYQTIIKVTTAADAHAAVQMLKQRGVDFIKTQSLVPREAYFATADESRRARDSRLKGTSPTRFAARKRSTPVSTHSNISSASSRQAPRAKTRSSPSPQGRTRRTSRCTTMPRKQQSSPRSANITSGNAPRSRPTSTAPPTLQLTRAFPTGCIRRSTAGSALRCAT